MCNKKIITLGVSVVAVAVFAVWLFGQIRTGNVEATQGGIGITSNQTAQFVALGQTANQVNAETQRRVDTFPQAVKDAPIREASKSPTRVQKEYALASQLQPIVEKLKTMNGSTNSQRALSFSMASMQRINAIEKMLNKGIDVNEWNGRYSANLGGSNNQEEVGVFFYPTNFTLRHVEVRSRNPSLPALSLGFFPNGKFKLITTKAGEEGIEFYPSGVLYQYWRSEGSWRSTNSMESRMELNEHGQITVDR